MADRIDSYRDLVKKYQWSRSAIDKVVDRVGGDVGELLGCGAIGCTFKGPADPYDSVLKLTADESEFKLWKMMADMQATGHQTTEGVPRVYSLGKIPSAGGNKPAYYVVRESVEPLVMGKDWNPGPRTRFYVFGEAADSLPKTIKMREGEWYFSSWVEQFANDGLPMTDAIYRRAKQFDENLRKIYDLTDVTNLADAEPSLRKTLWKQAYVKVGLSVGEPLSGIGRMVASILKETGSTWVTDLHLGNLGWRLSGKPQLLAYDWLTSELRVNGKLV